MIAKVEGDEEGMSRQTEGMRNVLQDLGSCGLDDVSVNKNFNKKSLTLKCQFLVCFESCLDCHKGLGINGRQTPAGTIELILHGGGLLIEDSVKNGCEAYAGRPCQRGEG